MQQLNVGEFYLSLAENNAFGLDVLFKIVKSSPDGESRVITSDSAMVHEGEVLVHRCSFQHGTMVDYLEEFQARPASKEQVATFMRMATKSERERQGKRLEALVEFAGNTCLPVTNNVYGFNTFGIRSGKAYICKSRPRDKGRHR